jgi:hypothetical protein
MMKCLDEIGLMVDFWVTYTKSSWQTMETTVRTETKVYDSALINAAILLDPSGGGRES